MCLLEFRLRGTKENVSLGTGKKENEGCKSAKETQIIVSFSSSIKRGTKEKMRHSVHERKKTRIIGQPKRQRLLGFLLDLVPSEPCTRNLKKRSVCTVKGREGSEA